MADLARRRTVERPQFRQCVRRAQHRRMTVVDGAGAEGRDDHAVAGEPARGAALGGHAGGVLRTIVLEQEGQALAVARPRGREHGAVERRGEQPHGGGPRRVGGDDAELVEVVGVVGVGVADQHRQARAVGAPHRTAALARRGVGHRSRGAAGPGLHHPHVAVGGAIRIGMRALADEGQPGAVGRPRRALVVDLAGGDGGDRPRGQIEDGEVRVEALEVAGPVFLEAVAVEHDRRRRLALPAVHLLRFVGRVDVADDCRQAGAVGRPLDVGQPALHVADLLCLAALPRQQPELRALLLVVVAAARRQERQVLAVRAPARRRLVVGRRGELLLRRAVPARHPQVGVARVLLGVDRRHGVGHPHAVGRALRITERHEPRVVVERQAARRGRGLRRGRGRAGGHHESEDEAGERHARTIPALPGRGTAARERRGRAPGRAGDAWSRMDVCPTAKKR